MRIPIFAFFVTLGLSYTAAAETHGGVIRSNAAFKAVADYALAEGGALSRVFTIEKLYRIRCDYDVYKIVWGGMDFHGTEHADPKPSYVAAMLEGEDVNGELQFKIQELNRPSCLEKDKRPSK